MRTKPPPPTSPGPPPGAPLTGLLRAAVRDGVTMEIVTSDELGGALVNAKMATLIDAEQPLDPEPEGV